MHGIRPAKLWTPHSRLLGCALIAAASWDLTLRDSDFAISDTPGTLPQGIDFHLEAWGARLGAIRKALAAGPDPPELFFVDPVESAPLVQPSCVADPLTSQTFILDIPTNSSADFDSAIDANATSTPAELFPRTWWFSETRNGISHYRRLDETLMYLRNIMEKEGPFDGVWGFSQGGAMAGILTLLVENPQLHPIFAKEGANWPPPQFKFAILGAGFEPQDQVVRPVQFEGPQWMR
ncbi:hypothetical protein P7C70_g2038, partial [Phenoliferia sp. Uapishka_3]